jgi:ubiquinone/menaquinone biosynthesis C-methylase UbiE
MGLYDKFILPQVIDWTCKQSRNMDKRKKVIPLAYGNVLEIGIGSGLNFPFYNKENIKHLPGIDPSEEIWSKNIVDTRSLPYEFEFIKALAENIPADSNSFDTVVMTFTLCSITDP